VYKKQVFQGRHILKLKFEWFTAICLLLVCIC